MGKVFNQNVIDFTNQSMEEINNELDLVYCEENEVSFPNNEIDMMTIELYSKDATDKAYEILYPKTNTSND